MARPNVVLFMPDQLRADALGWLASGEAIPWTPDPRFPDLVNGYRDRA